MSNILDFHQRILARGRHMLDLGRPQDARSVLEHLVSMPDIDVGMRIETLKTLNQIEFQAGRYRRARAYLRQAIELSPTDPDLYEQFALNIEADGSTPLKIAVKAIRLAVKFDSLEPRFWALQGRLALAVGKRKLARKSFRKVARLLPTSIAVLEMAVTGLTQLRMPEEAARLLMLARAEHEQPAVLRNLWERLRFEVVRMNQDESTDEPVVLKFPELASASQVSKRSSGDGIVRVDRGSMLGSPHILKRINLNR